MLAQFFSALWKEAATRMGELGLSIRLRPARGIPVAGVFAMLGQSMWKVKQI
jgi:hypothetical protein